MLNCSSLLTRFCMRVALSIAALSSAKAHAEPSAGPSMPVYDQAADGFVSVKGERSLVMGYARGLEIWAYPLQLLRAYRLRFVVPGRVASLDAAPLLHHVDRSPTGAFRVYVGPDFVVREHLFAPRSAPAAIIRYEVEGRADVGIEVSFEPSLDLMWPAALGGQSVAWDAARSGYVLREPLHGFTASLTSAEIVAHDGTENVARAKPEFALRLAPRATPGGAHVATLYVAADPPGTPTEASLAVTLPADETALRQDAEAHAAAVQATSLQIETPDADVNRALAAATLALDQAWVCNTALGCGMVAGYGPSRPGRRPQYAWFFAGDGLVAMQAMLDAGQYDRARAELEFIARYQNPRSGMIWHELSQSAALIDWEHHYPYMFVHVDITFQYLAAVQSYVAATGDIGFARTHWAGLAAAYRYCLSVLDTGSGLPQIPPGKQGQNEQDEMRDDIRLSTAWIDAADGVAALARATGHPTLAVDAARRAARARAAVAQGGWDAASGFWFSGHTRTGSPIRSARPDAIGVLGQRVFPPAIADHILDRVASPEFVTDWGVRSLSSNAPEYDPNRYGSGSVWALGTAGVATAFWQQHRPLVAWNIWHSLVAWDTLDSAGHLHEVLAGDLFHPELESVPEQTWSSAAFLTSAVHGLLGVETAAAEHRLRLAPHLPAGWRELTVRNIRVGRARMTAHIERDGHGMSVTIDNAGDAVALELAPMIPLGSTLGPASVDGLSAPVRLEGHGGDQHARLDLTAHTGVTRVRIAFEGGVEVTTDAPPPRAGDVSRQPKLGSAAVADRVLTLDAWVTASGAAVQLVTPWQVDHVDGGTAEALPAGGYLLHFAAEPGPRAGDYAPVHAVVSFR